MGITNKQCKAIQCLLTAPTQEEAAKMAGCSSSTLRRWLDQPEFVKAYQRAQTKLIDSCVMKARNMVSPAFEVLSEIMNDKDNNAQTRVYASRSIIEFSLRLVEINDILHKLESLEDWKELREDEYL
ncbi:hypothetical protein SAMN04487770_12018 [Butyrivibrio sp. ob235]|uniref:hypothetical protein n=1 Tax=Butyrivibrio sp. ob235 TaxID=1761780 RepID=UPI0008C87B81|nr:hypothetical protein [Butyrivibrio sp. ob235]SEL89395.1 hypothetical protein SAMN04487770_12018 [Butyrivibrio sp. ob235]